MKKTSGFVVSRNNILSFFLLVAIIFSVISISIAAAPDPGHNFTSVSGSVVQGDLLYGSAADTLLALAKDANATRYLSNTGTTNNPAWAQVNLANGVTGTLADGSIASALTGKTYNALTLTALGTGFSIAGGTTSKTLTVTGDATISGSPLSNPMTTGGDIIYGGASGVPTRLGNGSSGQVLTSGGTTVAPTWETPSGGGATMTTAVTRPYMATGANAAVAMTSLTARKVGLFNLPYTITVNKLTYNVGAVTTAGTMRLCVYNEAGSTKHIDVTDTPTNGVNEVTVSGVTLTPGNYYIAMGCATTCSNTIFMFTSTANTAVNTSAVPAGKKEYEGLYTMSSGVCDATIDPTNFTGTISHTTVVRLDN